jgi:orotidine-5'-phosphate decarboxylase
MPPASIKGSAREKLILALDVPSLDDALALVKELKEYVGVFKVGLELYARFGTRLLEAMKAQDVPTFFDCKFLDIPNTVARASESLVEHELAMFNVHAIGGATMLKTTVEATKKAAAAKGVEPPKILAVTVLTSVSNQVLKEELAIDNAVDELVVRLAWLAQHSGVDGVVASAQEVGAIREACGKDFLIITPGIRPQWAGADDQARIVTPADAMRNGSDYIVVGRPITRASNRRDAAKRIVDEMESAL